MKLKKALELLGKDKSVQLARQLAAEIGIDWSQGICYVFMAIANEPNRAPGNIGGLHDDEKKAVTKWLNKYKNGYECRASTRKSNPPGTVADPIIEKLIASKLTNLTEADLNEITYAHRLGMSAENTLGLMLEEYLSINLKRHGWHCAWGETVKSVDFVNEDGDFLQIKNRSNSENSSSSAVRDGTKIEKWYRIKADRVEYMWGALNNICGTNHLSEDEFVKFVKDTIALNPDCLAVEKNNPWKL